MFLRNDDDVRFPERSRVIKGKNIFSFEKFFNFGFAAQNFFAIKIFHLLERRQLAGNERAAFKYFTFLRRHATFAGKLPAFRLRFSRNDHDRNTEREIEVFQPESFRAEKLSKDAVERGDVDVVFRFGFYSGQFHQSSSREDRREKRPVRVSRALDLKTGEL